MKNVLIISSSLRKNSNSQMLAESFGNGAKAAGNNVEFVSLVGKQINFCRGCFACQKLKKCVISDDSNAIVQKMLNADVLVFATPIYYYEMSGQLKTLLDRANPLFVSDYKFRDVYFLSVAAEEGDDVPQYAEQGMQGWIDCFEKAKFAGKLFCGGVNDAGEIAGNPMLEKAFEMGKTI